MDILVMTLIPCIDLSRLKSSLPPVLVIFFQFSLRENFTKVFSAKISLVKLSVSLSDQLT